MTGKKLWLEYLSPLSQEMPVIRAVTLCALIGTVMSCTRAVPHAPGPASGTAARPQERPAHDSSKTLCATADDVLSTVGAAVVSGDVRAVTGMAVRAEDLLKLQNLAPSSSPENRKKLDDQTTNDIRTAVLDFRKANAPLAVARVKRGTIKEHAAIENIAGTVDQIRDAQIVFATPAGAKVLAVGMLIRIGNCWKILYI